LGRWGKRWSRFKLSCGQEYASMALPERKIPKPKLWGGLRALLAQIEEQLNALARPLDLSGQPRQEGGKHKPMVFSEEHLGGKEGKEEKGGVSEGEDAEGEEELEIGVKKRFPQKRIRVGKEEFGRKGKRPVPPQKPAGKTREKAKKPL
jgi:hypothetical protein